MRSEQSLVTMYPPPVCPGCRHDTIDHVGGRCYACRALPKIDASVFGDPRPFFLIPSCSWVILGDGNAWGVEPGWHRGEDLDAIADAEDFLGYRTPHIRYTPKPPK